MIKNFKLNISYILVLALGLTGCNLDEYPVDKLPTEKAWNTVHDAQSFRKGNYAYMRSFYSGVNIYGTDLQTDLLHATIGYGNNGGDLHFWDFTSSQYDVADYWDGGYAWINNANNIINNIYKVEEKTVKESDLAILANIKGEAYLFRAMAYHALTLRFAKDYEPETAETVLGLPLVTVFDIKAKPTRSTLKQTYDFIKSDITKAREFLSAEGKQDATYVTVDVIDAFEARVDLYMHNYAQAVELATKNLASYPLITDSIGYNDMWKKDLSKEVIFKAFRSIDERSASLGIYLSYSTGTKSFNPSYIPTQTLVDMFSDDNDIRKDGTFTIEKVTSNAVSKDNISLINKYPGNDALANKSYEYFNMVKVFRIAEQYLIASEAAYLNKDEASAVKWLNQLRTARGASEVTATGEELFEAIKKEWTLEFVGEGMRLDQLKRWHLGFTRGTPQFKDLTIVANSDLKIEKDNVKFVWEIPDRDRAANPNLEPNWR